jgi:aminoglycoside phosphotransferase (APT) family kinase protein
MTRAFGWLRAHEPTPIAAPVLSWGDARLSNGIYDDTGELAAALDWEQACVCPAEADFAWWLATRKQMLEVNGLTSDPELPGFDSRETVIARFEQRIGRPLEDLEWYEIFAMARMGCCIVRMHSLLRRTGQTDHGLLRAPILPMWVSDIVG